MQGKVVKNEDAISALLERYITLITHLAALRPIFIFSAGPPEARSERLRKCKTPA
jgi:hypothetical protein